MYVRMYVHTLASAWERRTRECAIYHEMRNRVDPSTAASCAATSAKGYKYSQSSHETRQWLYHSKWITYMTVFAQLT